MNGRKAKLIRKNADLAAFLHYVDLVDEDQAATLTMELVKEYTPQVEYVFIHSRYSDEEEPKQYRVVSDYTQRWFYLQEKNNERLQRRQYSH